MLMPQCQSDECSFGIYIPTGSTFTKHIRQEQEFVGSYRRRKYLFVNQFEHTTA